jgi:AcrR family transcriptional regulator
MAATPRLTRAERQQQTRAALIDAAVKLYVERGLHGTSVEAIAERAGFTRGAFYSNFATKEELFAAILQERIYSGAYREMLEAVIEGPGPLPTARQSAEGIAAVQEHPDGAWMFRLWLELLAHAGRDEDLRRHASEFWRENRGLLARLIERRYADLGREPPLPAGVLASAMIAMDIGLAIQHHVDPEAVPLSVYPDLFGVLFDDL